MTVLAGRVAIVTGAARGLGSVIRQVLERNGAAVVGVDLDGDDCLHADVGTEAGNAAMVAAALERYSRLDVLVLNAGVQATWPIAEAVEADFDRLMAVMAKGPLLGMKHAWPHLSARTGGRIVVTASVQSLVAERYKAAYVAAKHAVAGVVRAASVEAVDAGMTVNAVAPGWMMTNMTEVQIDDLCRVHNLDRDALVARWSAAAPGNRPIDPIEVAEVVGFLAGPAASGINGVVLPVDRGILASYFD